MADNIKERAIVPFNPASNKVLNKDKYNLYAPVADTNKVGMAGFNPEDFKVINQIVSFSDAKNAEIAFAQETADTAIETANAAQEIADTAQETADTAQTSADTAQESANAAQETADTAQETADTAIETLEDVYRKAEIDAQQSGQNTRLASLETKQGSQDISAIASNISQAILSLNEDVDSLQLGVVPRVLRGIVEANTSSGALTPELIALLNAKVLEMTGRGTPNNTDAVQILDTGDIDKDFMYTYYYWTSGAGTSEFDGWYLAYSALSQLIENEPSYTLNFTNMLWEVGEDNLYHIIRIAEQHEIGTDNTIDVDLLRLVEGNYEPISTFTVGSTGTVDIYTDEVFEGTLCIRTGKAYRVPTLNIAQNQVIGLEEDLTEIKDLATVQGTETNKAPTNKLLKESSFARVYREATEISGITYPISIEKLLTAIIAANPLNSMFVIGLNAATETKVTGLPSTYGMLTIIVPGETSVRMRVEFSKELGTNTAQQYIGNITRSGSTVTSVAWDMVITADNISTVMPISSAAASNDKVLGEKVVYDNFAPKASPTFTGTVTVPTPVNDTDAATKKYVDKITKNIKTNTRVSFDGNRFLEKTWTGLTDFRGGAIWTDGINIYHSIETDQYVLNVSTSTWSVKTWTGLTNFDGQYTWTDGTNIYWSSASSHYVLDVSTSTWSIKTWTGWTSFNGQNIWTDGTNIYWSSASSHYVLDVSTSTWSIKTWTGLTSFNGQKIWTDGANIYYSSQTNHYVLDVATSTWSIKTWTGLTSFLVMTFGLMVLIFILQLE